VNYSFRKPTIIFDYQIWGCWRNTTPGVIWMGYREPNSAVALKVEGKSVWDANTVIFEGDDKFIIPAHTDGDAKLFLEG